MDANAISGGVSDGLVSNFNIIDNRAGTGVFNTNPGAYAPSPLGGHFWVSKSGNDLYINYSAVPEPGSLLLVGLAGLGFAGYRRRKRRQKDETRSTEEGFEVEQSTS